MIAALDAIDLTLAEGRKVYLHCVGGSGVPALPWAATSFVMD